MTCYHKALDLDPKYVQAHYNLGNALYAKHDLDGAIACYRQLDEATRAGKRQAAPFAESQPKPNPRKPGRKPGKDYGTKA
jgi:hypothetical protein